MDKVLICFTLSVALSGCSGSGSSDNSLTANDTVNTSSNNGSTTETINADGNLDGTSTNDASSVEGSSEDGQTPGQVTIVGGSAALVSEYGLVSIFNGEFVEFSAAFLGFSQPIEYSLVLEQLNPALDSCEVTRTETSVESPDIDDVFVNAFAEPISAGDVLTINSPAGSYTELLKSEQFGFIFYELEEQDTLSVPAPADLTINIPGDQFSAFSNVPYPPIVELQVNSPSSFDQVSPSTSFSWTASAIADSFIEIDASAVSLSAESTSFISVFCTVRDDGAFSFPDEIQSQMGSSFSGFASISREVVNVLQSGSSVLAVVSSSEN